MIDQAFLDPLYGHVRIAPEDKPLVFSPEFQRLRYVRLCNINSLYLTGASEPKRFEHCIGVYHLARRWAAARGLLPQHARVLCTAALLHDLQTGPFGHSFQYVLEDNDDAFDQSFQHANLDHGIGARFHQAIPAAAQFSGRRFIVGQVLGADVGEVAEAVKGSGPFGPLISGTLDLDNVDNIVRLAFHTGICQPADRILPEALTDTLRIVDGRLAATLAARPLVQRWFELRRDLYHYLLLDRGEFSAKAMLTRALELAADARLLGPDSWLRTDDELLEELVSASIGESQAIRQIIQRLRLGDLFEPFGVWTTSNMEPYDRLSTTREKRRLEAEIEAVARRLGGDRPTSRLSCCIHFVKDHKKTKRLTTYLEVDTGQTVSVGEDSAELHIGLFLMNSRVEPLSRDECSRYIAALTRVLAAEGLSDLKTASEPLAIQAAQRGLFEK